jgi:hypothetical protein
MRFAPYAPFVTPGVTNWMTAAGIALIAGGIATLIGFRHALRGGDARRAARRPREIEARRVAVSTAAVQVRGDVAQLQAPRRRRALAAGPAGRSARAASRSQAVRAKAVADPGGDGYTGSLASIGLGDDYSDSLASIGLADDEEQAHENGLGDEERSGEVTEQEERLEEDDNDLLEAALTAADGPAADRHEIAPARDHGPAADLDDDGPVEECAVQPVAPPAAGRRAARSERYGDRVDGWVRPEYREADLTGQYWTPVPESAYADEAYGWPVPVERLPEVPPYPPASGFDVPVEVHEQTRVVPQWPPAKPSDRLELSRGWGDRNPRNGEAVSRWAAQDHNVTGMDWPVDDDAAGDPDQPQWARRPAVMIRRGAAEDGEPPVGGRERTRRRISPSVEAVPALGDSTQMLPPMDGPGDGGVRRPRPRPRPAHPDRSTVYVSKHAADPS